MGEIAKLLIGLGAAMVVAGVVMLGVSRLGGGSLPGDIVIERPGFTFSFPVVTCLVISVVLTVVVNLFFRR